MLRLEGTMPIVAPVVGGVLVAILLGIAARVTELSAGGGGIEVEYRVLLAMDVRMFRR